SYSNQATLKQQAVTRPPVGGRARAIRAVDRREQWIMPAADEVAHLSAQCTEPEGLAGDVAGRAAAPISAKALKKSSCGRDRPVNAVGLDRTTGVRKEFGIGGAIATASCHRRSQACQRCKSQSACCGD